MLAYQGYCIVSNQAVLLSFESMQARCGHREAGEEGRPEGRRGAPACAAAHAGLPAAANPAAPRAAQTGASISANIAGIFNVAVPIGWPSSHVERNILRFE